MIIIIMLISLSTERVSSPTPHHQLNEMTPISTEIEGGHLTDWPGLARSGPNWPSLYSRVLLERFP